MYKHVFFHMTDWIFCNHFINSISVKHALHFYVEDFDSCVQDTYKVGKLT